MKILLLLALVALGGCATQHSVSASTPRTVEINGPAWSNADNKKAFDMAQAECQKHGLHAKLLAEGGPRPDAYWHFGCVQ